MLPRDLRLHDSRCFQAVYRRGRSWANAPLVLHTLARPEPEKRFGLVVGKKLGGAVQRNRVRRRLREACRTLAPRAPEGVDAVIVARTGAASLSLAELTAVLRSLFEQAGLWAENPAERYRTPAGSRKPRPGDAQTQSQETL